MVAAAWRRAGRTARFPTREWHGVMGRRDGAGAATGGLDFLIPPANARSRMYTREKLGRAHCYVARDLRGILRRARADAPLDGGQSRIQPLRRALAGTHCRGADDAPAGWRGGRL